MAEKKNTNDGFNALLGNLGKVHNAGKEETIANRELELINKKEIVSNYDFSYCEDEETRSFLQDQAVKIHNTLNKGHTELGKILTETQEKLAGNNQYDGYFERWYTNQGLKKASVYKYISRYKYICSSHDETTKLKIESLPLGLSYAIASESCSEELRKAVLSGGLRTLKEFNEFKQIESKEQDNKMRDVTPISFETVDNKAKQSIKSFRSFEKKLQEKSDLTEEQLEIIDTALERAKKILDNAFKIIEK